jgi:hypothetical protein
MMAALVDWEFVEAVYEVWGEVGDIDRAPSLEEAREIANVLHTDYGYTRDKAKAGRIRDLLTNRRAYSPYVDDVALERIIRSQDWDAATSLTDREYAVLLERLTVIVDRQQRFDSRAYIPYDDVPWDAKGRDGVSMYELEGSRFARDNAGRTTFGATITPRQPVRVTFPDDHWVRNAVDRRRERMRRAQAAAA